MIAQGVLDKLKRERAARDVINGFAWTSVQAQLREAVFDVIHQHNPQTNNNAKEQLAQVPNGVVTLELVREFLEFYEFKHTTQVLLAEASLESRSNVKERNLVAERFGVDVKDTSVPLLLQILQQRTTDESKHSLYSRVSDQTAAVVQPRENSQKAPVDDNTSRFSTKEVNVMHGERVAQPTRLPLQPIHVEPVKDYAEEEADEDEFESSMAEEIASGSEFNESFADDQSESASELPPHNPKPTAQDDACDEEDGDEDEEEPVKDLPAPVPSNPPALPPLGALQTSQKQAVPAGKLLAGDEDDDGKDQDDDDASVHSNYSNDKVPTEAAEDNDDFDEELEAERLNSLDAKLKAMEAEDETGTLQQLKQSLQLELQDEHQQDTLAKPKPLSPKKRTPGDDEEEGDQYGSDFEEEEIHSDVVSEELEAVSDMPDDDDDKPHAKYAATDEAGDEYDRPAVTRNDKAVSDENVLNSYDYIEEVERD
ncbi:TPA: hypothetical protein N0F65_011615 [Lagenidium giganteum]|uniref:FGFR1 oncogene partner (FOP) N-terminal dimerisation domain-containing protein n=1 Tax=Lagenidium giganteum TaxID=4803 RepID=A0AAV2ZAC6_9STRA|nr:TPA: hypothetical protein N0F65_011615 [Lagenidium giganteum]